MPLEKSSLNIPKRSWTHFLPIKNYPNFPQDTKVAHLKILESFSYCRFFLARNSEKFYSIIRQRKKKFASNKAIFLVSARRSSRYVECSFQKAAGNLPSKRFSLSVRKPKTKNFHLKTSQNFPLNTMKAVLTSLRIFVVYRPEIFRSVSEDDDKKFLLRKKISHFSQDCPSGHIELNFHINAKNFLSGGQD